MSGSRKSSVSAKCRACDAHLRTLFYLDVHQVVAEARFSGLPSTIFRLVLRLLGKYPGCEASSFVIRLVLSVWSAS